MIEPKVKKRKVKTEAEEYTYSETDDSGGNLETGQTTAALSPKLKQRTTEISLSLPEWLLELIKVEAKKRRVPYQALIKAWLADHVGPNDERKA